MVLIRAAPEMWLTESHVAGTNVRPHFKSILFVGIPTGTGTRPTRRRCHSPPSKIARPLSTHSTATLHSSNPKPTARHLVRARRPHALNGNAVIFHSETNFFPGKTKKKHLLENYTATLQKDCFFFGFPRKKLFWAN